MSSVEKYKNGIYIRGNKTAHQRAAGQAHTVAGVCSGAACARACTTRLNGGDGNRDRGRTGGRAFWDPTRWICVCCWLAWHDARGSEQAVGRASLLLLLRLLVVVLVVVVSLFFRCGRCVYCSRFSVSALTRYCRDGCCVVSAAPPRTYVCTVYNIVRRFIAVRPAVLGSLNFAPATSRERECCWLILMMFWFLPPSARCRGVFCLKPRNSHTT